MTSIELTDSGGTCREKILHSWKLEMSSCIHVSHGDKYFISCCSLHRTWMTVCFRSGMQNWSWMRREGKGEARDTRSGTPEP